MQYMNNEVIIYPKLSNCITCKIFKKLSSTDIFSKNGPILLKFKTAIQIELLVKAFYGKQNFNKYK
jgi:hypothetical protein